MRGNQFWGHMVLLQACVLLGIAPRANPAIGDATGFLLGSYL